MVKLVPKVTGWLSLLRGDQADELHHLIGTWGFEGGSDIGFSLCTAPTSYNVSEYLKHEPRFKFGPGKSKES